MQPKASPGAPLKPHPPLIAAVLLLLAACSGEQPTNTPPAGSPTPIATSTPVVQSIPDEGAGHVEEGAAIQYKHYPPSSGTHYGRLAAWKAHAQEIAEGYWVHNLEHGGVVVLYNCRSSACPELESELKGLYEKLRPSKWGHVKLAVLPYSRITSQIAVVAWGYQMDLPGADVNSIRFFYNTHVDRGPEDAP